MRQDHDGSQYRPPPTSVEVKMSAPTIYHLKIERFRSIKDLSWHPAKGVNVILGGGDVGKTTILDAIGLLLNPTNATSLSDTDYHARDIAAGFVIEAVVALPPSSGINYQVKPCWPWHWDGSKAVVPNTGEDGGAHGSRIRDRVSGESPRLITRGPWDSCHRRRGPRSNAGRS